jgi:excisionase family DNA binding protein
MNEKSPSTIDIITPIEAAEILQVTLATIYIWIETDSTFPAVQIDKKWIVDRMKLNAWGSINKGIIEKSPTTIDIIDLIEAAEILRVSLRMIYTLIEEDLTFPAVKLNNKWRINRIELKAWYEKKFINKLLPQSELEGVNRSMIKKLPLTFDIITVEEAAQILRMGKRRLHRTIKTDPTFPAVQLNKKWVIDRSLLEAWYESQFSNKILQPFEFEEVQNTEEEA